MNQKNLNYEIETGQKVRELRKEHKPMNQKNLNYEIETVRAMRDSPPNGIYESKESQL